MSGSRFSFSARFGSRGDASKLRGSKGLYLKTPSIYNLYQSTYVQSFGVQCTKQRCLLGHSSLRQDDRLLVVSQQDTFDVLARLLQEQTPKYLNCETFTCLSNFSGEP